MGRVQLSNLDDFLIVKRKEMARDISERTTLALVSNIYVIYRLSYNVNAQASCFAVTEQIHDIGTR